MVNMVVNNKQDVLVEYQWNNVQEFLDELTNEEVFVENISVENNGVDMEYDTPMLDDTISTVYFENKDKSVTYDYNDEMLGAIGITKVCDLVQFVRENKFDIFKEF